ncbi:TetR/AcrR family transcriptional regulator [Actinocorallia libanotica]|uniref:HTH tetR-type domain-containing protein n=1 Tax=Actinocorallia libanotica TaxID=46162 RepID=A0ABN1QKN1_9ACTN
MTGGVRRAPVQRRSVERFERLLDACAALLAEVGHDALTTRGVAQRAGVPIGTLYQFFDGKTGLLQALAARNLELLLARVRERLAGEAVGDWGEAAVLVYDEILAMRRVLPGFFVADPRDGSPYDADIVRRADTAMAGELYALGLREAGLPPLPDPERVLLVAITSTDGVLRLAFQTHEDGDAAVIALGARLLRAYFGEIAHPGIT